MSPKRVQQRKVKVLSMGAKSILTMIGGPWTYNGRRKMNEYAEPIAPMGQPMMAADHEKRITLARHKELQNWAYDIKAILDAKGGLSDREGCIFGDMMSRIIGLK